MVVYYTYEDGLRAVKEDGMNIRYVAEKHRYGELAREACKNYMFSFSEISPYYFIPEYSLQTVLTKPECDLIASHYNFDEKNNTVYKTLLRDTDLGCFTYRDCFTKSYDQMLVYTSEKKSLIEIYNMKEEYILSKLYKSYAEAYNAVLANAMNLLNVPRAYKKYELCLKAVQAKPKAISFVPKSLIDDKMIKVVLRSNPEYIYLIPRERRHEYIGFLRSDDKDKMEIATKFIPIASIPRLNYFEIISLPVLRHFKPIIGNGCSDITKFDLELFCDLFINTKMSLEKIKKYLELLGIPASKYDEFFKFRECALEEYYPYSDEIKEVHVYDEGVKEYKRKFLRKSYDRYVSINLK